jgi:nucleotide-binding universal stress UspA family protein
VSIVVGIDGSEESKQALRWALAEARLRGTSIDAVYAWSIPVGVTWAPAFDEQTLGLMRGAAETTLADTVNEVVNDASDIEIQKHAIEGPPGAMLVAKAEGAELLVVGSRGLGGFKELLLGSVGHQCAQHAPCPVVIVRPRQPE